MIQKMLTRHNVVTETPHVETIPINLVATEDGRTLLAVTGKCEQWNDAIMFITLLYYHLL